MNTIDKHSLECIMSEVAKKAKSCDDDMQRFLIAKCYEIDAVITLSNKRDERERQARIAEDKKIVEAIKYSTNYR